MAGCVEARPPAAQQMSSVWCSTLSTVIWLIPNNKRTQTQLLKCYATTNICGQCHNVSLFPFFAFLLFCKKGVFVFLCVLCFVMPRGGSPGATHALSSIKSRIYKLVSSLPLPGMYRGRWQGCLGVCVRV